MASISSSSSSSSPNNPFRFICSMYHSITMQYLRLSPPIPINFQHPVVGYDYEVVIATADSSRSHGSSSSSATTIPIDGLYQPNSALISPPFPTRFPRDMYYQPYSALIREISLPFQFPIPNNIIGVVVPYSVSPYWAQDSPLQYHQIDIERQQYRQLIPQSQSQSQDGGEAHLGETFLSLTFQAGVGLVVFDYQSLLSSSSSHGIKSLLPPLLALHIVEAAMTIGFAGSLIGILLRTAYPKPAGVIEKTGSISAALGFFVMVCMPLQGIFIWIGWLGGFVSVVAFGVAVKKKKQA